MNVITIVPTLLFQTLSFLIALLFTNTQFKGKLSFKDMSLGVCIYWLLCFFGQDDTEALHKTFVILVTVLLCRFLFYALRFGFSNYSRIIDILEVTTLSILITFILTFNYG
jgi:hypothetical protein